MKKVEKDFLLLQLMDMRHSRHHHSLETVSYTHLELTSATGYVDGEKAADSELVKKALKEANAYPVSYTHLEVLSQLFQL